MAEKWAVLKVEMKACWWAVMRVAKMEYEKVDWKVVL